MGVLGQNRGRGGAILTPNKLVFSFGGSYVCANFFVKIDQEMRPRECSQTDRCKVILSVPCYNAIAMGQIIIR